ncbi:MAG: GIY-YIG nuclease family protein [Lentisphaerae bacterium]|nr:GIY-YIG nuclease family protein [Lentisphaerota bacterium]
MGNVSTKRLGDILNLKRGYDLPASKRKIGIYPVLSSGGVSGYHNESKASGPGVVIGRYGTLGEVYFVDGKYWPHNTALYVTDFKRNDPKYVYYLLKCLGNLQTADKSTVPGVNRNDLHERGVPYIGPEFQNKIAAVLSALDAKIELNNRINAELEAMAKTLYDYWFVQFDFPCLPPDYQSVGARKPSCHDREGKPSGLDAVCTYRAVGGLPVPEAGKHFVYVLLCLPASGDARVCDDCSFYIGMTDDLYRRWFEHKTGHGAKWTKANRPIKVIHHETFDSKEAAATREKELKTGFGRKWLKREYQKLLKFDIGGSPAHQSKLMQAGKMVYNEKLRRKIPEGWTVDSLAGLIASDKSGDWGKENLQGSYTEQVFCMRGADLNGLNGLGDLKPPTRFILKKNRHKLLKQNDFIVEISGGSPSQSTGRLAFVCDDVLSRFDSPVICSNFCRAFSLRNEGLVFYFSKLWSSIYDHGILFGWEGKTSGIKNLLFDSFVSAYWAVVPCAEVLRKFNALAAPVQAKKQKLLFENQQLTSLRDFLLPMLMNGQVQVA